MLLILKFALIAMLIGPSLYFRQLYGDGPYANHIIWISMIPGLLMLLACTFAPWEGVERFARIVARVGLVASVIQSLMMLAILALIAAGHATDNPGAVIVSMIAAPFVIWRTVRASLAVLRGSDGSGTVGVPSVPTGVRAVFSNDNITILIGISFVALTVFLFYARPESAPTPEMIASGGFFWLLTVMMIWFRLRRGDALAAAEGQERRYGRPAALITWGSSVVLTLALAAVLNEQHWQTEKPGLVFGVLAIAGIGAVAPFLYSLTQGLGLRITHRADPTGLYEIVRAGEIHIPWPAVTAIRMGEVHSHAALFVAVKNPEALLRPLPIAMAAQAEKRWQRTLAWHGVPIVIMASAGADSFNELIKRLRELRPDLLS